MSASIEGLEDEAARRRIREDFDHTFFVEAAAGTGKTTELTRRLLGLIESGRTTLDRVVAVTFTEKAAGEMKLRLRGELERARRENADPSVRARLDLAVEHLELAHIGTIHAFCAELLREWPIEAGIDPLFDVAEEDAQGELMDRAFDAWFERAVGSPGEGLRRALRRRPERITDPGPRARLRDAAFALAEHRDFPSPWRRDPFDRVLAIDRVMERLAALGELAARCPRRDDFLRVNLERVQRFCDEIRLRESVRPRDYDGLEADLRRLQRKYETGWHYRGFGDEFAPGLARADVIAFRDQVKEELDRLLLDLDADLAPLLRDELWEVVEGYEALKRREGLLDFVDLLLLARDLLRREKDVRASLQRRFTHFFVDEFQDTDPLQVEILLLLSADREDEDDPRRISPVAGKLFLVGDPKQSIYRFRRADVAIYQEVKQRLSDRGAEVLQLTTSFRSTPAIQELVNATFATEMRGGPTQADYVPLHEFRKAAEGQPSVVALPAPVIHGKYGKIGPWSVEQSIPDAIAAFLDWLLRESGWTVTERDDPNAWVPVEARHVCLLFRRMQKFTEDVTRPYVRALEARRIPHVLVGGRSFHEREEVLALRNILCAIEWPDDALRVFAALRGPLFALGDDLLLSYKDRHGSLHPLRPRDDRDEDRDPGPVRRALDLLADLHRRRNRQPITSTLLRVLAELRAHAGIAIWPAGEQALANVMRVLDLARRFERRGAGSFRAFVEKLEDDAAERNTEEAPAVEEGTEGVRIMTVHRAKGLEFPVVVFADPTCKPTRDTPSRHTDPVRGIHLQPVFGCAPRELLEHAEEELRRDAEEAVRLTYVATTRTRDLLVVPVVGEERIPTWFEAIHAGVYPSHENRRASRGGDGCPEFGEDSVLERPEKARSGPQDAVRPGEVVPERGTHRVVWWDPARLDLERDDTALGLRQQRILEADTDSGSEKERAHREWEGRRERSLREASRPGLLSRTVTEIAHADEADDDETPVEIERTDADRTGRPSGKRFGTLVHAVLACVEFDAGEERILALAKAQGRLVGATGSEVEHAARAVRSALAHPLLKRAATSAFRRECPVLASAGAGEAIEGVVDLAFREIGPGGPRWTVVDFKSDVETGEMQSAYERQVRLYARAVSAATGEPCDAVLLFV